jgi:hypothetical protein
VETRAYFYKQYPKTRLAAFWQYQLPGHPSGCGPYCIAMGANLISAKPLCAGVDVYKILERRLLKPPGFGIPSWWYQRALKYFYPDQKVGYRRGAQIDDLKQALREDRVVIVAIAWQTNREIFSNIRKATVGHYMVFAGYDDEENLLYFLDPGYAMGGGSLRSYPPQAFNKWWKETSNWFVLPGSMYTVGG